ncbi:metallophosphoesterase [Pseudomonas cichorii]|nr:metallophosphoesterase [Pseudomonas cichorii]MBX8539770.1 metallophosphoesterase [Pseudomonas cichorii]MBX8559680.1 metallophosphoesterase [Pseudomonas cichorii]MBX8565455.1 metallophosphoesterase [Pseudomonas cichorii]MBX8569316.1 metallophosphoesterase [Pseudomonas cichorii]MBX8579855.1 metallophosphoesterase [Pseudomonas cichorii]
MFHIYLTIAYLYVLVRFVYPLPLSWMSRGLIGFVLLVASKYHLLSVLFYGNMWSPELPYPVVLVLGWMFCSFVLLFVFMLVTDVFSLLVRLIGGRDALKVIGCKLRVVAAVAAAGLGGVGVYQAIQVPEVRRVELAIEGLPTELDGFRLVQLSDLHISRLFPEPWVRAVVERTNTLSADLIVVTGDFIDGSTEARRADVAPLNDLRALHGVIGIPGNHEYYFNYAQWEPVLQGLGIRMLTNEHEVVQHQAAELNIAGVTDAAATNYGFAGPDLKKALEGVSPSSTTILLSHRPEGAVINEAAGVDVQLSGHTHGGMIKALSIFVANANEGFASRGYDVGKMKLYVSNGTGLWMGFPIRLGVPSEITEFTLRTAR